MNETVVEQVRRVVAESFELDPARITEETVAEDVEGWDSLAHARLILRLQRILNITLDPAAASAAQSVGALAALVARTRNARG
jgi:acyl carrier protein